MKTYLNIAMVIVIVVSNATLAGQIQAVATDMTPIEPLPNPLPDKHQPRYLSGFGSGDSFTLFFEDRDKDSGISYVRSTDSPDGLPALATPTNVKDTHFCVKDWPITINGTNYAYRAWGAMWNTPDHRFYVSNDLTTWQLVNTFRIPTLSGVPGGTVYYGFHDVVCLNGSYYAWGECNIGHTLICRSAKGDDVWEAFDRVGGFFAGPLQLPAVGTPTGSFFELGYDRGYGKIMVPGDDSAFYLAVNTIARPSLAPAQLETAFINPANWTWHDGSTGPPAPEIAILRETVEHDLRECWVLPWNETLWAIIYDADFGSSKGGKALGYAMLSALPPILEVAIDIRPGSYPNPINLRSRGVLPVAILSDSTFDATTVDPGSVTLAEAPVAVRGKKGKWMAHQVDVNRDGLTDLVVQVEVNNMNPVLLQGGYAVLMGETCLGQVIMGMDEIVVIRFD